MNFRFFPCSKVWVLIAGFLLLEISSCTNPSKQVIVNNTSSLSIGKSLSTGKTTNGKYISWREHIIDDTKISGISGSDGLSVGDLDKDGHIDIVSVHESDTAYDGIARGHIRIAFGNENPDQWELITLAEGAEAGGAEDVAIADINGDGFPDVIGACELAHLIYFQNPGKSIRNSRWERLIPSVANNKGSYIRVFSADLNKDGQMEIIAANKGDQLSDGTKDSLALLRFPVSYFEINGDPLNDASWTEQELMRMRVPINSEPIDIDGDGDMDIIAGSRGEGFITLFENKSTDQIKLIKHNINIEGSSLNNSERSAHALDKVWLTGFNMDYADLNGDNKLDIVLSEYNNPKRALGQHLVWLEQPDGFSNNWTLHPIGNIVPDLIVGLKLADINDDGRLDVMTGGYSRGERVEDDANVTLESQLGRLAWFEQPADLSQKWDRHEISRRKRGMFDKFIAKDMDRDGDVDFISTRGNSLPYDGVFWLEQVRTEKPNPNFKKARHTDSEEMALPF